ncbi:MULTISPECIES: nucleotide disphospho-sugar-binding domain-containing protein [unclassified Micromonospora]|uniref:nucleotide disphospho-sugar-binding domain-containing protein n=1 Tax=unclassified Micromonospora TaxID=2617518 RepID=UPI00362AF0AF
MRVLFVTFPATAHLFPIVPLAWALQSAGHEVLVASHSGVVETDMTATIAGTGLTPVPLGARTELPALARINAATDQSNRPTLALDPDDGGDWERTRSYLVGLFSLYYPAPEAGQRWPMADALVEFARSWRPDLVLWDPLCPPAAIAARACGAAHARVLWGRDHLAWMRERAVRAGGTDPLVEWLRPLLDRYGDTFDEEVLAGQWTLDLVPERLRLPADRRYVPVRRVPYTGGGLPDWLAGPPSRPRVCLTLGVSTRKLFSEHQGFSVRELLALVADLDVELVATLNDAQLAGAGELPPNVRVVEYLPLTLLLPTCAAVIHHGGGGTYAAAVAHQVPQLILPVPKWDETATARYVVERGAGLRVDEPFTVTDVRAALLRLLREPRFRDGARSLHRDMLATPSPVATVPVLERLTGRHRRFATAPTMGGTGRSPR